MHFALEDAAISVHDAASYDVCNTCKSTLLVAMLDAKRLPISHVVALVVTEEDRVSLKASFRKNITR